MLRTDKLGKPICNLYENESLASLIYKELSKSIRKRPITYLAKNRGNSQNKWKWIQNKISIKTKGEIVFHLADCQRPEFENVMMTKVYKSRNPFVLFVENVN